MRVYTITEIASNVCEVKTWAYTNYEQAITQWNKLYEEHKKLAEESREETDQEPEEYSLDPYHKHYDYDNGEYYIAIDLDTHTTKKEEYNDEDLELDVDWLTGYGIDEEEAKKFIKSLLNRNYDEKKIVEEYPLCECGNTLTTAERTQCHACYCKQHNEKKE